MFKRLISSLSRFLGAVVLFTLYMYAVGWSV